MEQTLIGKTLWLNKKGKEKVIEKGILSLEKHIKEEEEMKSAHRLIIMVFG